MHKNQKRPNILFIMTDEQRFDCIGYVNPAVKTPNLDQLANESVNFQNAYTTNPSCVPARAAIFTGRYPSQCGAPTYITHLPDSEVTFMSLLQKAGYHTAVVGKQHFGTSKIEKGYDYEDIIDQHAPKRMINSENSSSYEKFLVQNGFTYASELTERDSRFAWKWKENSKYYIDSYIGERGKEWLVHNRPTDKPWFLCISFPGPHMPYDGIGLPHAKQYNEEEIDLPCTTVEDLASKPPHYMSNIKGGHGNPGVMPVEGITEQEIRHTRHAYYANMSLIDEEIGEIIELLKENDEYDNTMIIFTTDHGDYMGDFGMMGKGQYLSEVLMRIPFLIKPPVAQFEGRKVDSFISSVEIAATCLTAAGAEIPENISGRSLTQFWEIESPSDIWEDIYLEAGGMRSIRTKKWKLIYYANRPYGELYDLEKDPWERENLWSVQSLTQVKLDLMERMANWMIKQGARSWIRWNVNAPSI